MHAWPAGMRGAFRRPTRDGVRDMLLDLLGLVLVSSLAFLAVLVPLYYLPTGPAHSARPTQNLPGISFFGVQNRIQNFTRFLKAFWLPKWCPKAPKMKPKSIQNPFLFRLRFPPVFSSVLEGFFVVFRGARPSI